MHSGDDSDLFGYSVADLCSSILVWACSAHDEDPECDSADSCGLGYFSNGDSPPTFRPLVADFVGAGFPEGIFRSDGHVDVGLLSP